MSAIVGLIVRGLGLVGVSLSPFWAGAIVMGAIAAAAGGVGVHLYNAGWNSADAHWQAKALQSQIDALTMDRDQARAALSDERLRVADIERQANADKEGTSVYVDELKKTFAAACALDDADLRFLRERAGHRRPAARAAGAAGWLAKNRARAKIQ